MSLTVEVDRFPIPSEITDLIKKYKTKGQDLIIKTPKGNYVVKDKIHPKRVLVNVDRHPTPTELNQLVQHYKKSDNVLTIRGTFGDIVFNE